MQPKVTISLLGWNSQKYLNQAFASVIRQTYPNLEVIYIDNASRDGSVDFVRQNFPQVKVIANERNLGYAAGHNIGIQKAKGQYVVCMNPDIILEPDFISQAIAELEKKEKVGALGGKLLRMLPDGIPTDTIDSTGFKIFRSRRVIDRGHGEKDRGQYDQPMRVFGVSGALLVLRQKALEEIKVGEEYFDVDFENYKEDIDLCWRLNLAGWACMYAPQAVAYHERGTGLGEKASPKSFFTKKRRHSYRAKYFSFKNHTLMLVKNDFLRYYFLDLPFIFFYELKRWGYVFLREPRLLCSFFKMMQQLPRVLKKRQVIMRNRRIKFKEIRGFLNR